VQQELRRVGLDPGAADGNLRPQTTRAIETYQRARGVPADGRASAELLARLEVEPTSAVPSPPVAAGDATPSAAPGSQVAAVDPAPGNGYAAFKAGFGAAQVGDFDMAVRRYSQAIDSGDLSLEHLAAALYNRANAYHYLGVMDKAIDDYSAAIANMPRFPDAYYNRGFAHDLQGEQSRAVEDFRRARDLGLQRLGVRAPDLPPPLY
jgi:tetratricopeptide (TPR) repeat protein